MTEYKFSMTKDELDECNKLAEESRKLTDKFINDIQIQDNEQIDKLGIESCKNMMPPLKGEITKGKLKWRGITLGVRKGFLEYWVMQRGKQISPTLKITREMDTVNYKYITKYQFLKNEGKQWDL